MKIEVRRVSWNSPEVSFWAFRVEGHKWSIYSIDMNGGGYAPRRHSLLWEYRKAKAAAIKAAAEADEKAAAKAAKDAELLPDGNYEFSWASVGREDPGQTEFIYLYPHGGGKEIDLSPRQLGKIWRHLQEHHPVKCYFWQTGRWDGLPYGEFCNHRKEGRLRLKGGEVVYSSVSSNGRYSPIIHMAYSKGVNPLPFLRSIGERVRFLKARNQVVVGRQVYDIELDRDYRADSI